MNGKLFPYLDVGPHPYRFRVVNASNSRFYDLALSNGSHLLTRSAGTRASSPAPVPSRSSTLAPAERADLIVDFRGLPGANVVLKSQALELMQFRVAPTPPAPRRRRSPPSCAHRAARRTHGGQDADA